MKTALKIFLIVDLIALNFGLAFLLFRPTPLPAVISSLPPSPPAPTLVPSSTPNPTPTATPSVSASTPISKKDRRVIYLPIPGNGGQLSYDWYTLPGTDFYFDLADFPGFKEIYFEANIRLLNGNGTAFVRLFDTTNSFIVQNSQIQTNNQVSTAIVSSPLTFHSGKNLIKVQVKSLTADTAIFDSGRLKIITEN